MVVVEVIAVVVIKIMLNYQIIFLIMQSTDIEITEKGNRKKNYIGLSSTKQVLHLHLHWMLHYIK